MSREWYLFPFFGDSLTYLLTPTRGIMLGAKTGPREPRVVNGETGGGCWAADETPQDSVLPKEQRDWDNRPPQSRLHGPGHPLAPGIFNPGVQDRRCYLLLQSRSHAACCLVIPGPQGREHDSLSSHSGDSGPEKGSQVPWWELGQTFLFAAMTCGLCLVSGPAQAQDKIHKKSSRSIDDDHLMSL